MIMRPRLSSMAALLALVAPLALAAQLVARPSFTEPSLSPDGQTIAFASGGDIWTVSAAGGAARLLVSHIAHESRPLWSPDGARLAFMSTRTGNGDIYVLTLKTGELARMTYDDENDQLDAWSRDGQWLYFSSPRGDIAAMSDVWRVRSTGGTPMPVVADRYASEYWAAPSPDGHTLAISARGVASRMWWRHGRSHLDETELTLVTIGATPSYKPLCDPCGGAKEMWAMWSADGNTVYYVSDRSGTENLYARAAAGGAPKALTNFRDGRLLWPQIAYNGSRIVFERDFRIWSLDIASGKAAPVEIALEGVAAAPAAEHLTLTSGINSFELSPDGKKVAFIVHGEVFAASAKDGGDAERVTTTPGTEARVTWAADSRRIVYESDRDGGIYHQFMYDFGARTETQLTRGDEHDVAPRFSPDGRYLAYQHGAKELRLYDLTAKTEKVLATGEFDRPPFVSVRSVIFSPDSRWIAYLDNGVKGFTNTYVVPVAGGASRQVSFLSNSFGNSVDWSRDGKFLIAQTYQRTESGQLVRIDLQPRAPRFREDQFRDLFAAPPAGSPPAPADSSRTARDTAKAALARGTPSVDVNFDNIRLRTTPLGLDLDASGAFISPDGRTLLVVGSAAGQQNLYTVSIDETSREEGQLRSLTSGPGPKGNAMWSRDGTEIWYTDGGRLQAINVATRNSRAVNVSAEMDADFAQEKIAAFNQAWGYLRDNFYDERMNGADWDGIAPTFREHVAGARTPEEMRRIMNLMIGELNASHSGMRDRAPQGPFTGRLGLRFDRLEYESRGAFKVSDVVPMGPAALAGGIKVGDYITAVDGTPLSASTNLEQLLAYKIGKLITLGVASGGADAKETRASRDVRVRAISLGAEKNLFYRAWVEERRAYVAKASGGTLGYAHLFDMGEGSLRQFYVDLDAETHARDGVVIDVRNNNGGFVNAYALDVLSRKPYLTMQGRGRAETPARSQLGQRALERPTVLVTSQHSLSDAEDFTEGYRTMGLGKVVGEPTGGWIIYTSDVPLIDGSSVRLPGTRVRDHEGKDMENAPRPVDVPVKRAMGEWYQGVDSQLDAAVRVLLKR
jgi:Tol biopolymer transport system component